MYIYIYLNNNDSDRIKLLTSSISLQRNKNRNNSIVCNQLDKLFMVGSPQYIVIVFKNNKNIAMRCSFLFITRGCIRMN